MSHTSSSRSPTLSKLISWPKLRTVEEVHIDKTTTSSTSLLRKDTSPAIARQSRNHAKLTLHLLFAPRRNSHLEGSIQVNYTSDFAVGRHSPISSHILSSGHFGGRLVVLSVTCEIPNICAMLSDGRIIPCCRNRAGESQADAHFQRKIEHNHDLSLATLERE